VEMLYGCLHVAARDRSQGPILVNLQRLQRSLADIWKINKAAVIYKRSHKVLIGEEESLLGSPPGGSKESLENLMAASKSCFKFGCMKIKANTTVHVESQSFGIFIQRN
jgi:hypothetical protein